MSYRQWLSEGPVGTISTDSHRSNDALSWASVAY